MNRHASNQGFTLIEILIASTLLAVMMTMIMGSLKVGAQSWGSGEERLARLTRMQSVHRFLREHLSVAIPLGEMPKPGAVPGPPTLLFRGEPERLIYVGTLPPQVRGGMYRFELYIAGDDDRRDLKLSILTLPTVSAVPSATFDEAATEPVDDVTLVENIEAIKIGFLQRADANSGTAGSWVESWEGPQLPLLIRIDIAPRDEPPWPTLTVAPRIEGRR